MTREIQDVRAFSSVRCFFVFTLVMREGVICTACMTVFWLGAMTREIQDVRAAGHAWRA